MKEVLLNRKLTLIGNMCIDLMRDLNNPLYKEYAISLRVIDRNLEDLGIGRIKEEDLNYFDEEHDCVMKYD